MWTTLKSTVVLYCIENQILYLPDGSDGVEFEWTKEVPLQNSASPVKIPGFVGSGARGGPGLQNGKGPDMANCYGKLESVKSRSKTITTDVTVSY